MDETLELLANKIPHLVEDTSDVVINFLLTDIKVRIFENSEGVNGALKGGAKYSVGYAEFRRSLGRQTNKIDLQLYGDLINSIVTDKSEEGASIKINDEDQADKARGIEELWSEEIFSPTDNEAEDALTLFEDTFNYTLDSFLKEHGYK